jgi:hypothetical protein
MKKILVVGLFGLILAGCSKTGQGGATYKEQGSGNSQEFNREEDTRVGPNASGIFNKNADASNPFASQTVHSNANTAATNAPVHAAKTGK